MGNTRTPVLVGFATMGVNVALSLGLGFTPLGFYALPLANALAATFQCSVLWWKLHHGPFQGETPAVRDSLWKIGAASVVMGVVAGWVSRQFSGAMAQVISGMGTGAVVFVGVAWVWRLREFEEVRQAWRRP